MIRMLLLKFNLKCNFACDYCYQNPIKPDGTEKIDYDAVEKVVRELHEKSVRRDKDGKPIPDQSGCIGRQIVLHGGEPLFQDKSVIERFLKLSNELYGR